MQCTILSPKIDAKSILQTLRYSSLPEDALTVHGTDDDWEKIVVSVSLSAKNPLSRIMGKTQSYTLRISYKTSDEEGFRDNLVAGAHMYAAIQTEAIDSKLEVVRAFSNCQMMVGLVAEPELNTSFKELISALTIALSGVVLLSSGEVVNERGKLLLDTTGQSATSTEEGRAKVATTQQSISIAPEREKVPPTAERVIQRALVLLSVAVRAEFEHVFQEEPQTGAEKVNKLRQWLVDLGLDSELEVNERHIIDAPFGAIPAEVCLDATWQYEAAAVLVWALGYIELPAPHSQVDVPSMLEVVQFMKPEASEIFQATQLASLDNISEYQKSILAVHWRLRSYMFNELDTLDFKAHLENSEFAKQNMSLAQVPLLNNDLAIDGKAIAEINPEEIQNCLSIVSERHIAANWLIGWDVTYSKVDNPT